MSVEAPIFDIQRFSIHDGPGIRTLVFFKGCNLRCDWCQNPESQHAQPLLAFHDSRCQQSLDCLRACEYDAIRLEGYRVDHTKCQNCLKCIDACSYNALRLVGEQMTPTSLMAILLRDKVYYQNSGGGVTFSGGEPTLYPKFMAEILQRCKQEKIHTTLETCGSFSFERWHPLFTNIDLIYFDLKIIDREKHQSHTRFDNTRILENARQLKAHKLPVEFRVTLVQGITDTDKNIHELIDFLKSIHAEQIHLLRYHNMGEAKIDLIHGDQKRLGLDAYPAKRFDEVKTIFLSQGIKVLDHESSSPDV